MTGDHGAHDHTTRHSGGRPASADLVLAITGAVFVAEVIGGLLSGSLALLADAGHMLTDATGLVLALIAASLAPGPPTPGAPSACSAPRCWPRWPTRCCWSPWPSGS